MRTIIHSFAGMTFALGVLAAALSPGVVLGDDAFEQALSLASEKRYSDAREVLGPLLRREPVEPRARLLHGVLRAREGRVGEAIEIFEALRRDHPDMTEPYNNLAVLYAVEGRLDDARKTLVATLERRPDPVLYVNLGDVYTNLARRAYDRARELGAVAESGREQGTGSTPAAFCAHAGGFRGRRAVADAALWLQSYGAEVIEVRHEERRTAGSYRIYLPPFENREQAAAKLREIRKRGVRDVAIIPDGDLANGISFGIYREADNMHRRVAALGKLGYSARSHAEDLKVVKEYAIRARAGGMPATLDAAWTAQFPGQAIRVVDCG